MRIILICQPYAIKNGLSTCPQCPQIPAHFVHVFRPRYYMDNMDHVKMPCPQCPQIKCQAP